MTTFMAAAVVLVPLMAAGVGHWMSGGILHPMRRALTPGLVQQADRMVERAGSVREDFDVRAVDGATLRGWKMKPQSPNPSAPLGAGGDWVLLYHGVSDNRAGMLGYAEFLLRHGYSVVLVDARAHGASDGPIATYGWKEREDTRAVVAALEAGEKVHCLFALGESMGGAVALQSAAVEPHIAGVVAESAFASLREVSYDYSGLRISHWLGRTVFRPAASVAVSGAAKEGGFDPDEISPEKAVAARPFPVLLICGLRDRNIPARHTEQIFRAASGPKELWLVPGAIHTGALGTAPAEFEQRVVRFFSGIHAGK